jgi:hypothetical protein
MITKIAEGLKSYTVVKIIFVTSISGVSTTSHIGLCSRSIADSDPVLF